MKVLNQVWNVVLTGIMIFLGGIIVLSMFSSPNGKGFLGHKGYTVMSGSMEPTLIPGDFIVVETVPYEEILTEDIITFENSRQVIVTHRVSEEGQEGLWTKGDNNNTLDVEAVTLNQYIGRKRWRIPFLGSILLFIQRPPVVIGIVLIIIIYLIIVYYFSGKQEKSSDSKQSFD